MTIKINKHEAMSVEQANRSDDRVITAYRCHPFTLMRGRSIRSIITELLGRQSGMSHGKGGSMHLFTLVLWRQWYRGCSGCWVSFCLEGPGEARRYIYVVWRLCE